MKKFRLLTAIAVVAMFMTSCEMFGEDGFGADDKKARFLAYTEKASRTTMGNNYSVLWSEGDAIALLGVTGTELAEAGVLELSNGAGTQSGVFEGDLEQKYDNYYAYYPADNLVDSYSSGQLIVQYPTAAVYTERNFVDGANPMVATGNEKDGLQFRNLCGIIEFQLTGSGNITKVYIEVGYGDPMISGQFVVSAATCEYAPYVAYNYISAQLAEPIALSTESRSIYAILPPGEYKELRITTYDELGNATTRLAKNTITVERSVITPVSEFDHQTVDKPHVSLDYLEEQSNFCYSVVRHTANSYTSGYYRALLTESVYEGYKSQGLSDEEIALQYGKPLDASATYKITTYNVTGQKVYVLALPYDEQGNYGEVAITSFVVKSVPIDNSLAISIADAQVDVRIIDANFDAQPAEGVFLAQIYTAEQFAELSDSYIDGCLAANPLSSLNYSGGKVNFIYNALSPNTEYKLVYRVANGVSDGVMDFTYTGYSEYKVYTFTTPEYEKSNAAVTLSNISAEDWTVTVNYTSANASRVRMLCTVASNIEDVPLAIDGGAGVDVELQGSHTFTALRENTHYYVYALAYDENDVHGEYTVVDVVTTDIVAGEDSSDYQKFIGAYTLAASRAMYSTESRTVTIEQGLVGKTYLVKGLIYPSFAQQYAIDDTIVARYIDGQLYLGGTSVADKGNVPADIWVAPFGSGSFMPGGESVGYYSAGMILFYGKEDLYRNCEGLIFYYGATCYDYNGNIDFYDNLTLTKQTDGGEDGNSNSTESFIRNEEVDAGWN